MSCRTRLPRRPPPPCQGSPGDKRHWCIHTPPRQQGPGPHTELLAHAAPRPRRAQEPRASWRRRSGPAYEREEAHEGGAGCWEGLLATPGACAASWLTVPHAGTRSSPSHSRVTETQPCHTGTHNITRGRSDQSRSSSSSSTATTPLDKAAARDP